MATQTQAQPATSAPASAMPSSDMGGFGAIAAVYDRQRQQIASQGDAMKGQIEPILSEIDADAKHNRALENHLLGQYQDEMQRVNMLQQRQRLITMHRAQALRKALPIIGIFALIGGALDGVTGAMTALGGGLAGLSQGMNKKYQEAWSEYDGQVKTMLDQAKDTQSMLKSIIADDSKPLTEKLALLRVESAHMPVYNQINNSEANAYARWVTETSMMDKRIQLAETVHKKTADLNKPVSAGHVEDAMSFAFPFTPPDLSNSAGINDSAVLSAAEKTWKQQHRMAAMQVATIASDYMHKTGSDWPSALRYTVSWLHAHHQMDTLSQGSLSDESVETDMAAGGAPAANVKIVMAPGTPASVAQAARAAAAANAHKDASAAKGGYADSNGNTYSAAAVAQAAAKVGMSVAAFVKSRKLTAVQAY